MTRKYQNHIHYFNYCRKILLNSGFAPARDAESDLFKATQRVFIFTEQNINTINQQSLRTPMDVFSFRLSRCSKTEEIEELLQGAEAIIANMGECVLPWKSADWVKDDLIIKKKGKVYKVPLDNVIAVLVSLMNSWGIYKLYDENRKLIYIGKSYTLGSRIPSSIKERKASYVQYCVLDNKADTDIYEIYYIALLKPPLNGLGINEHKPSMVLPDLVFTDLMPLYCEEVAVNG